MIIIDSNCFIFAENEYSEEHELAIQKIKSALSSGTFGLNIIIASETFHILSRILGINDALTKITNIVNEPLMEWIDFSDEDFKEAARLSKSAKIRINDAMIAQSALRLKVPILTDNVKDFKKVSGLEIIPLR